MSWRASLLLPTALAVLLSLLLGEGLLQGSHGAWNLDEEGYRLAAWQLAEGRLCLPLPIGITEDQGAALRSVHSFLSRGTLCAKYPPGAPLFFAAAVKLGWPRLGPALATGLAVLTLGLLGRRLGAGPRAAWLALACPLLLLNGSLWLSEALVLATLGLGLAVTLAGGPFLGGLALGFAGCTKPALAAAALPAFAWAAGPRGWWSLGLGGLPGLGGLMVHDLAMTGSPLTLAFSAYWPLDRPGFGPELGGHPLEFGPGDGHSPAEGLRHLGMNALLFALWACGHGGALLLSLREGWARRGQPLVQALALFALGLLGLSFAYWYPGEPNAGPIYLVPLLLAVLPLAAAAEGRLAWGVLLSGVLLSWGVAGAQWQRALGPAVQGRAQLLGQTGLVVVEGALLPVANLGFEGETVYALESEAVEGWWRGRGAAE
ncbi:MAG: hypothetical protein H6741_19150 [Alphaproteobacteria bacterium]|nr:hypothetical protein [Alphaproteobacteria bacterium]MCB9794828.1 hypothetical protein [Alphaproteobacteria bacterium]